MICRRCKGQVKIIQTYSAGGMARTSVGQCDSCRARYSFMTVEVEGDDGAFATATKLRQAGEVKAEVVTGQVRVSKRSDQET